MKSSDYTIDTELDNVVLSGFRAGEQEGFLEEGVCISKPEEEYESSW